MTNARIAGFTFLSYIAVALPSGMLMGRATDAEGTAAKLAHVAAHASDVRLAMLLTLLGTFAAIVLAVTLYGITRDEDHEMAMLGMAFRVCEGMLGAVSLRTTYGLLWLTTAGHGAGAPDAATANTLGALLLMPSGSATLSAIFFAMGSTAFAWLLLRGRMIPVVLAWIGVVASALLVVGLPLQVVGLFKGPVAGYMWMPMLLFEVPLGFWLLLKGAASPARRQPA